MRILLNDVIQYSNADDKLKSPQLSEVTEITEPINIIFDETRRINSIGIGNIDYEDNRIYDSWLASSVYSDVLDGGQANTVFTETAGSSRITVSFNDINNSTFTFNYEGSGLYLLHKEVIATQMIITFENIKKIGRIGAGMAINIPTAIPKEPAFCSTSEPRITLSGQIIQGRGGYNYRQISLDSRYKVDEFAMDELINGHKYIGMGYPFFIDLTVESYKLPYTKFYGIDSNQQNISFEGGIRKFLYSRRFVFRECF